ncbi:serine/threonine-protein kinase [Myxococcus sp. RHSTA-1-4]|uniref:serine/threonine-protein kinase n=1 Tax=Myxococcus sp. RHSTA-1-4 TaxID=2874601 RepID=UPI001CBBFE73
MSCFDEKTAHQLAAGQLPSVDANRLRRHAEGCRQCAALLARVTPPGAASLRLTAAPELEEVTARDSADDELITEPVVLARASTARADATSPEAGSAPDTVIAPPPTRPEPATVVSAPSARDTEICPPPERPEPVTVVSAPPSPPAASPSSATPASEAGVSAPVAAPGHTTLVTPPPVSGASLASALPPAPSVPGTPAAPRVLPAPASLAPPPAPPPPVTMVVPPPAPPQSADVRALASKPFPSASAPRPPVSISAHASPSAPPHSIKVRAPAPVRAAPQAPPSASSASESPPARKESEPSGRATVGRYHILDKLGSGGMGVVYSAYDPELHRRVAIKLLHPDANTVARVDGASRLLREAQAMARLSHPNVVSIHDVGTFAGRVFIAMELVEGLSLRHWLRAEHRTWREVLEVFRQAGRGLAAAHAAGLVHRDFKPANVLVSQDGRAQVTDFGLARTTADQEAAEAGRRTTPGRVAITGDDLLESPLTEAGLVMGTPAYMPPEQHEDGRTDARGDQFSFCASLYEALYGQLPFEGKRAPEYLREARSGRVRPPPRSSRVPAWLFRAISRGLSPSPDARYPSMGVLLEALGRDPSAAWRRRGAVAAAALLLTSAVGLTWWAGNRRQAPCRGSEARLAGIWDAQRKVDIQKAFTATGKPHAAAAFTRVAAALDGFAREWTGMHREACEATRVRGHQSDEVLSLRMACLDRRRSALDALTGVLAQTDAESLDASLDAAQRLPSVAACANVEALRRGLPESPEQQARMESLRARVDRATALVDAGRYSQAREELKAALEQSRAPGFRPVLAEALELEGRLGLVTGDEARARAALRESLFTAQALRHDQLAARAAARLVTTVSSEASLAEWSVAQARASIERAGGAAELEALLQTSLGRNAFLRGQYAQAAEAFGRSATLREKELGAEHLLTLESLRNQAAALSRTPETEHAASLLRRVLETTERVMGPDHPQTAMAANAVGYHLVASRRFEEGMPFLRRAITLEEQALGPDSATLSYPLNNLADALESLGRYTEARPLRERALALDLKAYGPTHPETATDLAALGELALREGKPRDAVDFARRSVDAYETFQKDHPDLATPLTTLGQALLELRKTREARAALERALSLRTAHPGPGEELAETRFALARALVVQDGPRARALATQALTFYGSDAATFSTEATHLREWLQGLKRRRR